MEYQEIIEIADHNRVKKEVIDKDWILGHFLNAMFSFPDISENFVFKGGTCLRKNYFPGYRFSEDLDFTLLNRAFVVKDSLLNRIIKLAEKNSGARFYLKNIKEQRYKDIPQGYKITVLYWGASHKPNQVILPVNRWLDKIKVDISFSEELILQPEQKPIFHDYSDSYLVNNKVPVYPLKEIVAEKLRSLMQRNRPRDIYDLYYLKFKIKMNDYGEILNLLKQKSKNKNIKCCIFDDFINHQKYGSNKRAWKNSLGHHLPEGKLVDYDIAYSNVSQLVRNILKA